MVIIFGTEWCLIPGAWYKMEYTGVLFVYQVPFFYGCSSRLPVDAWYRSDRKYKGSYYITAYSFEAQTFVIFSEWYVCTGAAVYAMVVLPLFWRDEGCCTV